MHLRKKNYAKRPHKMNGREINSQIKIIDVNQFQFIELDAYAMHSHSKSVLKFSFELLVISSSDHS